MGKKNKFFCVRFLVITKDVTKKYANSFLMTKLYWWCSAISSRMVKRISGKVFGIFYKYIALRSNFQCSLLNQQFFILFLWKPAQKTSKFFVPFHTLNFFYGYFHSKFTNKNGITIVVVHKRLFCRHILKHYHFLLKTHTAHCWGNRHCWQFYCIYVYSFFFAYASENKV